MTAPRTIGIQDVVNSRPVSRFQKLVILLCFLVVAIDGFDTTAVSFIAPALRTAWKISPAQLAPLFGTGLFGLMIGAFLFGPLADKIGRKPVLVATTLFFGLATIASAFASLIEALTALRFITGLGLGGAMPAAITITSEFCPGRKRSPMLQLFAGGLALGALLLWETFFMSLLVFYLLSSWLALLITSAGFTLAHASLMAATLATGGTVGAIAIGRLMDRFDPHIVLAVAYVVAGGFVVLLGSATGAPWLLVFAIFGAGFGAAAYYPTASRATGVSWANAVGRTGSILGSMTGGVLLGIGWTLPTVFTIAAVPAFLAGVAILVKRWTDGAAPVPAQATVLSAAE